MVHLIFTQTVYNLWEVGFLDFVHMAANVQPTIFKFFSFIYFRQVARFPEDFLDAGI